MRKTETSSACSLLSCEMMRQRASLQRAPQLCLPRLLQPASNNLKRHTLYGPCMRL